MPTLAGNKHPSVHFFLHGPRLFYLSTKKVRVRSVGNGHQSDYSRADTTNNNINKGWKTISIRAKYRNTLGKMNKIQKIKFVQMLKKVHNYMLHRLKSTVGNKTRLFPSPFHVSTSSRLTLAGAFRGDYAAACSTVLRSATEENDSGGYVGVPCPSKVKQRSSSADWLEF